VFDQYLRDIRIPVFEYYLKGNELYFRWNDCVQRFDMPLEIYVNGDLMKVKPTTRFTSVTLEKQNAVITIDPDYYVASMNMTGK
jgi:hypothetical protein